MVQLQDFNDPPPSRRPWIILLIIVLAISFLGWRIMRNFKSVPDKKPAPAAAAPETNAVAPVAVAPVSNAAPDSASSSSVARVSGSVPPAMLEEEAALEKAGQLVEAREKCLQILDQYPGAAGLAAVEEKAGALGIELVMKPHPMPEKTDYVVAGGDTLDKIAKKFACTKELIVTNNLVAKPALIKKGDHYRVLTGVFKVRVNKTRNELLVTLNNRFFKRYPIGTGKFGKTPVGVFVIGERIAQPVWWKPDGKAVPFGHPDNILGTYWLALRAVGKTPPVSGYGIHGTWDDSSVGKAESLGCIRLHNADVEQLYVMLPVGTEVVIEE